MKISFQDSKPSCCCEQPNSSPKISWQKTVDVVCRIALAILSACLSPVYFAVSCGMGILLGGVYAISQISKKEEEGLRPVCAQGFMNYLSGMRFPEEINSLVTAVFIGEHVRHDPIFFVPFVGLFFGTWLGSSTVRVLKSSQGTCKAAVPAF